MCSKNSQFLLHSESFLHSVTQTCQGDIPGIDVVVQQVGVRVVVDVGEVIPDGRKEVALAAVLVPECWAAERGNKSLVRANKFCNKESSEVDHGLT